MFGFGRFDETADSDKREGAYGEPQVFVKGLRQTEVRGNRFGARESFTYSFVQFVCFKPDILWNTQEILAWLLVPSLWVNSALALYSVGVTWVFLAPVYGVPLLTGLFLMAYGLRQAPGMVPVVSFRLLCVLIAVFVL